MTDFLIIALSVMAGALVQGTIGVGFALIMVPVAALLQPDLLPVSALALMAPLNVYVLAREWRALDWRGSLWILSGRALGTAGGIAVLIYMTPRLLDLLVGLSTVLAAALTLRLPAFQAGRKAFFGAGVVTGITETAVGIGGPPLALVYQHHPAPVIRASLAACFLAGQILSIGLLAELGRISTQQIEAVGILLGPLALGAFISQATHTRLNGAWIRRLIFAFAIGSGVILLLRGLIGLASSN